MVDPLQIVFEQRGKARPFLAERERRGVLQMGAADLQDIRPFRRPWRDAVAQALDLRDQPAGDGERRRHVHGGRKGVVGGLRGVGVVVGMHRRLLPSARSRKLAAAVGDHLVDVHVELRAAAADPDRKRKLFGVTPAQNFVADGLDQPGFFAVELAERGIGAGAGLFQQRIGLDHFRRHLFAANGEIFTRALRLRAPKPVCGRADLAQRILFDPEVVHGRPRGKPSSV